MHIEPGLVAGAKALLGAATAAAAGAVALKLAWEAARERGLPSLAARGAVATALAFASFEVLPHWPAGVSEVHLILGSTLFLLLGAGPAAIGLAGGLLLQGLLFAPLDLPQLGMNVTTLLAPLLALRVVAGRVVAPRTPYVDLRYGQVLALSATFQGGVVAWVAFWALWGQGFAAGNLSAIAAFGGAYLLVVLIEPLVDLATLAAAKAWRGLDRSGLVAPRLHGPA